MPDAMLLSQGEIELVLKQFEVVLRLLEQAAPSSGRNRAIELVREAVETKEREAIARVIAWMENPSQTGTGAGQAQPA